MKHCLMLIFFPGGTAYCAGHSYIAYVFCALDTHKYMAAQVYIWVLVNTSICMCAYV